MFIKVTGENVILMGSRSQKQRRTLETSNMESFQQ